MKNMNRVNVICSSCGHDETWEDFKEMVQVNAQVGSKPRIILVGNCACGNEQEVADVTEE